MKFLVASGGFNDNAFGILTFPQMRGIPSGIKNGLVWGADLGCLSGPDFVKKYDPEKTKSWLEMMKPYLSTCLFVTVPDHIGDAAKTYQDFHKFDFGDFPVAYVAQDGQENIPFPNLNNWKTLFIGGSTQWKLSDHARVCIELAKKWDMHVHIGRVNYKKRYVSFGRIPGSERFTCDGTRIRYERTKALQDWKEYMGYTVDFCRTIFERDYNRQSPHR